MYTKRKQNNNLNQKQYVNISKEQKSKLNLSRNKTKNSNHFSFSHCIAQKYCSHNFDVQHYCPMSLLKHAFVKTVFSKALTTSSEPNFNVSNTQLISSCLVLFIYIIVSVSRL